METDIRILKKQAAAREEELDAFCEWLGEKGPSAAKLDKRFKQLLEEAMAHFDCTTCAACCTEAYVVVGTEDIGRMAKAVNMTRSDFRTAYVARNEDNDQCFDRRPCPFLARNKLCKFYESRPDCCREYPYSLAVNCRDNLDNLSSNFPVCPVIYIALDNLREELV
jgi:Fe-S-cluster containining protein